MDELRSEFDAVFMALGAQSGMALPVPGGDAPNVIAGVSFLRAFNDGRLQHTAEKVLVVGGGDTSMDVAAVARRLGHITHKREHEHPENIVMGYMAHDVASVANRQGAHVTLISRETADIMPATKTEVEHTTQEGVTIIPGLLPTEIILDDSGRAVRARVIETEWNNGEMTTLEGTERELEFDLLVSAIGQRGDLTGFEELDNGRGLLDADGFYRVKGHPDLFAAGDIIRPHLLTTAIGQASIAAEGLDAFLAGKDPKARPKVDVHRFNLLEKLKETNKAPAEYPQVQDRGTCDAEFAVHNYEDRAHVEIIPSDELFLGHFGYEARNLRKESTITADSVLGEFGERIEGLTEEQAQAEAKRCMSCGMCFECDNCVVFCPQDAVFRVKKDKATMGRYVDTDYTKCIGCHICADVCPTGYIQMGLGE
jgi:thioredoxin reductase/Pyruvate/2-oxoacid:ferredoxin oxidoreductase delta subunit